MTSNGRTKKPAAKKPAAKKPAASRAEVVDLRDPDVVPKLLEMGRAQERDRLARDAAEAQKPEKPLRGAVETRPSHPPCWGYGFEFDASIPADERASLEAFFARFTTLGGSQAVLVTGRDTPAEARRVAWAASRETFELEQLRAHLPPDDVTERTARLRRALAAPSMNGWYEVVMLLSTWEPDSLRDAIAVADEGLARWPASMRFEPSCWKERPALRALCRVAYDVAEAAQDPDRARYTALSTQEVTALVEHHAALPRLEELAVSGKTTIPEAVVKLTGLRGLRALEMQQPTYDKGTKALDLKKVLKAPHLRALDGLSLYGYTLSAASLDALAGCEQPLTRLRVEYGHLDPAAGAKLAALAARRPLRSLMLKYNELGPEGAARLFARPDDWRHLRALDISANEIGDEGALALTRARLDALRWLSISSNDPKQQLTARAAKALAAAPSLGALEALFLMGHPIGTDGVVALLTSPSLRSLRRLNVSYSGASLAQVVARCADRDTAGLTELNLGGIDTSKPARWSDARFLSTVRSLSVDALDGGNYAGLLGCPHLGALEVLVLGGAYTRNAAAAKALAAAPRIPSLRYVDLSGWKPSRQVARAIARSPMFQGLWGVQLLPSYVQPEAWQEFYEAGVPLVNGAFYDRFPANEYGPLTVFRDEVL